MAPAQSKELDASKKKQQLSIVKLHCFLNAFVSMLNYTTRAEILRDLVAGDFARTASYMTAWTGCTAIFEFLLNPTIGGISDSVGRKPLMLLSPYFCVVLKSWVLFNPSLLSLTVEKMVCDGLRTLTGTTMGTAAVSDLCTGSELATETSAMMAALGASIILGPLVGSQLSTFGSYKFAIAAAVVQLVIDQLYLMETLTPERRVTSKGFINPLGITRLFTTAPNLTQVSKVMMLHNLVDMKIMADPSMLYQMQVLKWPRSRTQIFSAVFGMGMVLGKPITKWSLAKFGPHGHTTNCHYAMVLGDLLFFAFGTEWALLVRMLLGWYGVSMGAAVKAIGTGLAVKSGMGKGEYAGLAANLRAAMVIFGPFLFGNLYKAMPALPFLMSGAILAMAEAQHRPLIGKVSLDKK